MMEMEAQPPPLVPHADFSPLFPVQPWEEELEARLLFTDTYADDPSLWRKSNAVRATITQIATEIATEVGSAMDWAQFMLMEHLLVDRHLGFTDNLLTNLQNGFVSAGDPQWHFVIERHTAAELALVRQKAAQLLSWSPSSYTRARVTNVDTWVAEEQARRANLAARRNAYGEARHVFGASGAYDHLTSRRPDNSLRMDRHSATHVGSFLTPFITQGPIRPGPNRESGPVRSNAVVLADLAQAVAAAALAAQANPAGAVNALVHFASDLGDLVDSVAKKPRTQ